MFGVIIKLSLFYLINISYLVTNQQSCVGIAVVSFVKLICATVHDIYYNSHWNKNWVQYDKFLTF